MKVMQLISSGGYYGAESVLVNLVAGLLALDCDVHVCVFENQQNPHMEVAHRVGALGAVVNSIPCHGRIDWNAIRSLRDHLRKETPSLLHTHGYKADIYGYLAAHGLPIVLLSTCHNWTNASRALRLYGIVDKLVLRKFSQIVGVSSQVGAELQRAGIPSAKITIIDNGIPLTELRDAGGSYDPDKRVERSRSSHPLGNSTDDGVGRQMPLVIAMAARLVPQKGIHEFLCAAAKVLQTFPNTQFVIAGQGPSRSVYEVEAKELQIASHVDFVGHVQDMTTFYDSVDIFALPSYLEGLPMSLLEAMAAGKAIVTTNVGAIPNVILEGDTGLLVEPGEIDSLAEALCGLINDPGLRRKMGERARALVAKSYSSSGMTNHYLALYKSLVAARTSNRTGQSNQC